jgi:hypothetical protein
MHFGVWVFRLELENVANIGGSEGIERLIVVTNDPEVEHGEVAHSPFELEPRSY